MNTTKITFYIMPKLTEGPLGDCKTLTAAKTLANKHGVSMIYARQNGALNGSAMFIFDISTAIGKWSLLSADESWFAERATPANPIPHIKAGDRRFLAETAAVYSMDVARVAGRDGDES